MLSNAASTLRKENRAVATRFDKLAVRYKAVVQIVAINLWLSFLNQVYSRMRVSSWVSVSRSVDDKARRMSC